MRTLTDEEAEVLLQDIAAKMADPIAKHEHRRQLWSDLHALAEKSYRPALPLFVQGLDDPHPVWRYMAVCDLGFHYGDSDVQPYLAKFRLLVQTDPDEDVRRSAATIVGGLSAWPEPVLLQALTADAEDSVRETAFEALLGQLGVTLPELRPVRLDLRKIGLDVTVAGLNYIAAQRGFSQHS